MAAEIIAHPATRGRGPTPYACASPIAGDPQTRALPAITALFAEHVKARSAVRLRPSRARAERAVDAFAAVVEAAEMAVQAPPPRSLAGLGALAATIAMSNEGALDLEAEDTHAELAALIRGVLAVTGYQLPPGHEGLSGPA